MSEQSLVEVCIAEPQAGLALPWAVEHMAGRLQLGVGKGYTEVEKERERELEDVQQ